jgi:hypothetical protein
MLFTPWLSSVKSCFRRSRNVARRQNSLRNGDRFAAKVTEVLERKTLLTAPEIVSITPNNGLFFDLNRDPMTDDVEVRAEAPRELVFRFSPGQIIDPATLDGGIRITRSGFDDSFGEANDVIVTPGYIGVVDPANAANDVTLRFAETLPDDTYRLEIIGSSTTPLRNNLGEAFRDGSDFFVDLDFDLGAQVVSVVQQPVIRHRDLQVIDPSMILDGDTVSIASASSYARLATDFGTSGAAEIQFEAAAPGDSGNQISVEITTTAVGMARTPIVTVTDTTVSINVNSSVGFQNTIQEVIDAVNGSSEASALLSASLTSPGGTETSLVDIVVSPTTLPLAGGGAPVVFEFVDTNVDSLASGRNVPILFDPTVDSPASVAAALANAINSSTDFTLVSGLQVQAIAAGDTVEIIGSALDATITLSLTAPASLAITDGDLTQRRDTIVVYFNDDDLNATFTQTGDSASDPSVVDPSVYQLYLTRETVRNTDDVLFNPVSISYDPARDLAILTFEDDLDQLIDPLTTMPIGEGTFRLRIGNNEATPSIPNTLTAADAGSSFDTAYDLSDAFGEFDTGAALVVSDGSHFVDGQQFTITDDSDPAISITFEFEDAAGMAGIAGNEAIAFDSGAPTSAAALAIAIRDAINTQTTDAMFSVTAQLDPNDPTRIRLLNDTSVVLGDDVTGITFATQGLVLSAQIQNVTPYIFDLTGAEDEPGHRTIQLAGQDHSGGADASGDITTAYYNFRDVIGSVDGQTALNAITEEQKQRTREILELYSNYTGIEFIESDTLGFTVATGDMRALSPTVTVGAGGTLGIATRGNLNGIAIMDNAENWDDSFGSSDTAGLSWFAVAMHEIGHILGLGHADELPVGTIMGGSYSNLTLGGEPTLLFTNDVEPVFPGEQDLIHTAYTYEPASKDIDTYRFQVEDGQSGVFTAETFAERQADDTLLDTLLTLYRENADGSRDLIARNDDYFSKDSFLEVPLTGGTYYITVTSTGNDQFDPTIPDSGFGGTTQGAYDLRLNFTLDAPRNIVDVDNATNTDAPADAQTTLLDGDFDGSPGGAYNYWFRTASETTGTPSAQAETFFVDKNAAAGGDGTLAAPFRNIDDATAAAAPGDIIRIIGNSGADGDLLTLDDNVSYQIGLDTLSRQPLDDGVTLEVPREVTLIVDAGAVFQINETRIGVGSSDAVIDRAAGALQVLGTPESSVYFTSYNDQQIGLDSNPDVALPGAGDWGGIVFRSDVDFADGRFDYEREGIFLNYVNHADIRYGGGEIPSLNDAVVEPIQMIRSRPTISFNNITLSADAAMSASPNSFRDDTFHTALYQFSGPFTSSYDRIGPDIVGNTVTNNTINGLSVNIETPTGGVRRELSAPGRFDDTDIVHVVRDNLIIDGNPGGPILDAEQPPATLVVPSAAASTSLLGAGTYNYRVTYVDRNGFEGPASDPTASITISAGDEIRLDGVPTVTGDFVARRLYRSQDDGNGPYELVAEVNGTTTTLFDNGETAGGNLNVSATRLRPRLDARLRIDPGIVVKLDGARIEGQFGAQVIAEGVEGQRTIITSFRNDDFGFGGTFDTNGDNALSAPLEGDWGGIYIGHTGVGNFDHVLLSYAGGITELDGDFAAFNAIEVHQADVRIANSILEHNADGRGGTAPVERLGRGRNEAATIFVRGSQPVIIDNTFEGNEGPVVNINVNALNSDLLGDTGRTTGFSDIDTELNDNQGPLIRRNFIQDNGMNGLQVRGGTLATQSVWDDTDIVHVLFDTVYIPDFQHFGGLRLESNPNESLVIKLSGGTAGFEATGRPLDIDDRIGGMLHVIGQPGFPVVLTSLQDDTVGAGFDPQGFPLNDTNNDGTATSPSAGDWNSVRLDQFSHDRNIGVYLENESSGTAAPGTNAIPATAESVGELANGEKDGDENLRLGFELHGYINSPNDIDIYSFEAEAGTEVWFDIDRTTMAFDPVIELVDFNGNILAQSDNSTYETLNATSFPLVANAPLVEDAQTSDVNILQKSPSSVLPDNTDQWTTNPRDAGFRVVLPGGLGTTNSYYIRIRSSNIDALPEDTGATRSPLQDNGAVNDGLTWGVYQLGIRLRETDEFAGSTIQNADIRYAQNGIEIFGMPAHSPLLGEVGEDATNNNTLGASQVLGNLLNTDRATLSIAGDLANGSDVDFFRFDVFYDSVQMGGSDWLATTFDIDYADGLARADTILAIFDAGGNLVLYGTDSNVADDRPAPLQANDVDDLTRGTVGALDAYIGSVELPEGTYYAAVSTNELQPRDLDQFYISNAANKLTRLEPINQSIRIVEDHIGDTDALPNIPNSPQVPVLWDSNSFVPFNLGDVGLFVSTNAFDGNLYIVDPFTGQRESYVGDINVRLGDVAMRYDGELFSYSNGPITGTLNDGNTDDYILIDTGFATTTTVGNNTIQTFRDDPTQAGFQVVQHNAGMEWTAVTFVGTGDNDGFAVGHRNSTFANPVAILDNILYQFNQRTGVIRNRGGGNDRTGDGRVFGAGTQKVEIGQIDTTVGLGGQITGIAEVGNTLYAVDDLGGLYTVSQFNAFTTFVGSVQGNREVQEIDVTNAATGGNFTLQLFGENTVPISYNATAAEVEAALLGLNAIGINESQRLQRVGAPTGGNFRLQFGTQVTGAIAFDADAAAIQAALEGLIGIGAGDVAVNGTLDGQSESFQVSHNATGGTFTITVATVGTTGPIAFDADNAMIQAAMDGLLPGAFTVVGNNTIDMNPMTINALPNGALGEADLTTTLDDTGLTGGTGTLTTLVDGVSPVVTIDFQNALAESDQPQLLVVNQAFTGGVTPDIAASTTQQGSTDIIVTGGDLPGVPIQVEFVGQYATTDVPQMVVVVQNVTGGAASVTTISNGGAGIQFEGLAVGPDSVEGGIYANTLFGISSTGRMYAFDTTGTLQPIFVDGQGFVDTGLFGVTGLDFGTLDQNLWHVESNAPVEGLPGHGVFAPFDGSRDASGGNDNVLYFGNTLQSRAAGNKNDLQNTEINDYNFPGGAHGTIESNTFSLEGYAPEDLPVLYFNYYLETDGRDTVLDPIIDMRDSLRVSIAGEDGIWHLVATNNSARDDLDDFDDEFDDYSGLTPRIEVQELFDNSGSWRQARVSLEPFAGRDNLRIRIDFTSAGEINVGDANTVGDELRILPGVNILDGEGFTIDGTTVFEFERGITLNAPGGGNINDGDSFVVETDNMGMPVFRTFEFDLTGGVAGDVAIPILGTESAVEVAALIEAALISDGIVTYRDGHRINIPDVRSVVPTGLEADFVEGAYDLNDPLAVPMVVHGGMTPAEVLTVVRQALADTYSAGDVSIIKTYNEVIRVIGHSVTDVDDTSIGLSRRQTFGGFVTENGLPGDQLGNFYDNDENGEPGSNRGISNDHLGVFLDDFVIGFAERGEIVTGSNADSAFVGNRDYFKLPNQIDNGAYQLEIRRSEVFGVANPFSPPPLFLFQSFDTNDRHIRGVSLTAPAGNELADGESFVISDGVHTLTFEFEDLALDASDPNFGVTPGRVAVGYNVTDTADQVAEAIRDAINSSQSQNVLDLTAALSDGRVTGTASTSATVILVGSAVADVDAGTTFTNTSPVSFEIYGRYGDQNLFRDQGQVIVRNNIIRDSGQYGVVIDVGQRSRNDLVPMAGALPHPGAVRNFEELNTDNVAPGVVVVNNVVATGGTGGIHLSGDNAGTGADRGPVPIARIVNNTVYGNRSGDTGIRIDNNASPTIMNNIVANTNTGIFVDTSSTSTVITTNYFQSNNVNGNIGGALFIGTTDANTPGTDGIARPDSAALFVDAARRNFYLDTGARPVDSARLNVGDRPSLFFVRDELEISRSPIVTPDFDLFGQKRVDDPSQELPGEVKPDIGAVERADFDGPTASLVVSGIVDKMTLPGRVLVTPSDTATESVLEINDIDVVISDPLFFNRFVVKLADDGIGVDDLTLQNGVTMEAILSSIVVEREGPNGTTVLEGVLPGVAPSGSADDAYQLQYNSNTDRLILTALTSFQPDRRYRMTLDRTAIKDLAGNLLRPNQNDSMATPVTVFDVLLTDGVNDPPVITAPAMLSTLEFTPVVFSTTTMTDIVVADADAFLANPELVRVTLTGVNGTSTLPMGFTGITFVDAMGMPEVNAANDGDADAVMRFEGSLADVNAVLEGLSFLPNEGHNDDFGVTQLIVTVNDLGNFTSPTQPAEETSVTIDISVAPANSMPRVVLPGDQTINEDTFLDFTGGTLVSVNDALDGNVGEMLVTLDVANGTLTLNAAEIGDLTSLTGDGTGSITLTGAVTQINEALDGMQYVPNQDYSGTDVLTVTIDDQGNTGGGPPLTDSQSININVTAINDDPVNNLGGVPIAAPTITVLEHRAFEPAFIFDAAGANLLTITDVDVTEDMSANSGEITVNLTATNGTMTLSGTTGLTFSLGTGSADVSMTFTGHIDDVNAALVDLSFNLIPAFIGTATVTITTDDGGRFGAGGVKMDTDVITLDVVERNDAPVNTVPGMQMVDEDPAMPLVFSTGNGNLISIFDEDAGGAIVQVSLTATNGSLVLNPAEVGDLDSVFTDGVRGVNGDGDGSDGTLIVRGTVIDINEALDGLAFTPTANFNGAATVTIDTNDLGNTGNGGDRSDLDTVDIDVLPTNDNPVVVAPMSVNATEDTDFQFSVSGGTAITISDPIDDPSATGTGDYEVSLTVTSSGAIGSLTLGGTVGLTLIDGDGSDGTLVVRGTQTDLNVALNGLIFTPPPGEAVPDQFLTIDVDDLGNIDADMMPALQGSATVTIIVDGDNDAPVNTVPGPQSVEEDVPLLFTTGAGNAIQVVDLDAGAGMIQVTLTATNGTVSLNPSTVGMVDFAFTPDGEGSPQGDGTDDTTMTFRGTLGNVNAALEGMSFTSLLNFAGPAQVEIETNDLGNSGVAPNNMPLSDLDIVPITVTPVNDAPIVTTQGPLTVAEDTDVTISAANGNQVAVSDVDLGSGKLLITLTVDHGTLRLFRTTGLVFSSGDGIDDQTMTFSGGQTAVNLALDGMIYTPDPGYVGMDTLTIELDDQGSTGAGGPMMATQALPITITPVNDAPVLTLPGTQSTNEDVSLTFAAVNGNAITAADVDVNETIGGEVEVTLGVNNGTLTLSTIAGLTGDTDGSDGALQFQGTLNAVNVALSGLRYTPTANFSGTDTLDVEVSDLGNTGTGGILTDDGSVAINVAAVNDAPVNSLQSTTATVSEDPMSPLEFSTGTSRLISVSDADVQATEDVQVTLTVNNGTLTLNGTAGLSFVFNDANGTGSGDGTDDSTMTFRGTLADINAALDGLNFEPNADYSGSATLTITSNDLGQNGSGGAKTDTDTVTITVSGVNDAPMANDDSFTVLVGSFVNGNVLANDSDVDGPSLAVVNPLVTDVMHGTLNIDFVTGQFTYTPNSTTEETSDSFQYTVTDGALAGNTATVTIGINAAPTISGATFSVAENSGSGTAVGTLSVSDVNMDNVSLSIIAGNTSSAFAIDNDGNITVNNPAALDFESTPNFTLTVRATDDAPVPASREVIVTVNLTDAAEAVTIDSADFAAASGLVTVRRDGTKIRFVNTTSGLDIPGAPLHKFANVTSLTFIGQDDASDTLTVDFATGNPLPAGGLSYEGGSGAGSDTLVLEDGGAVTFANVTHTFTSSSSGSVDIDGQTISYTGLEPIADNLDADARVFNFGAAADEVVISDATAGDGLSTISSTASSETVTFDTSGSTVTVNLGGGDDSLVPTGLDSTYAGRVIVNAGDGADTVDLSALTVDATVNGNNGNDTITGGSGNDQLVGNSGDDVVSGGDGDDNVIGGAGRDTVSGGAGNNMVDGNGTSFDVLVENVEGNVVLTDGMLTWDTGSNTLARIEGVVLVGSSGSDSLDASAFTLFGVRLEGGDGNDTIRGTAFNDVILADGGNDLVTAGSGNDIVFGGAGDDLLIGNAGADQLNGDDGNDRVLGGAGVDTLSGGLGNDDIDGQGATGDVLRITASGSNVTVSTSDIVHGAETDLHNRVERIEITLDDSDNMFDGGAYTGRLFVYALGGNDTILGGLGADVIFAGTGDDIVDGRAGNDIVYAGSGADAVRGGTGLDRLIGNADNDTLLGSDGNDVLFGGAGRDSILGEAGDDLIKGQGGFDKLAGGGNGTTASAGDVIVAGTGDTIDDAFSFDFDALLI